MRANICLREFNRARRYKSGRSDIGHIRKAAAVVVGKRRLCMDGSNPGALGDNSLRVVRLLNDTRFA
jgi:hypothetical protein